MQARRLCSVDAVYARNVPINSGPIQFGSCEIGNTTGNPATGEEGEPAASCGSAIGARSTKTNPTTRERKLEDDRLCRNVDFRG